MRTADGRLVEPVRLPSELAGALAREAQRRGQSLGRVAGDLIAEVLPDALAEAARDLLTPHLPADERNPGALSPGVSDDASDEMGHQPNAAVILPGTGSELVTGSGGSE